MRITLFKNQKAQSLSEEDWTLEQLRDKVTSTTAKAKERLPWLKLAKFGSKRTGKNCLRHNANVVAVTGGEGDYDGEEVSFTKAVALLRKAEVKSLVYTSASHTEERPRWRVVFPSSRDLDPGDRERMVARVNGALGGILGAESFTLSQAYYYGSVEGRPKVRAAVIDGDFVDLRGDLDAGAVGKPGAGAAEVDDNPFLRAARSQGLKPPMDADSVIASMHHGNINESLTKLTASMLSRGVPVEDIVSELADAVEEHAAEFDHWDRGEEEDRIRDMCTRWLKKNPELIRKAAAKAKPQLRVVGGSEAPEPAAKPEKVKKKDIHAALGASYLDGVKERKERIIRSEERVWYCRGNLWEAVSEKSMGHTIDAAVEAMCQASKVTSTQKLVGEARAWVFRNPAVSVGPVEWDAHGKIPTRSGLLDPKTLKLEPLRPEHYCTYRVECEYDPKAKCPWWLKMLDDVFSDKSQEERKGTIRTLQELVGVSLIEKKPRTLMRACVLVGVPNSGKSNLLNAMGGLTCDTADFNATGIDALEGAHGTMAFLRRAPWVLHEAFDQSKWHFSSTVKALLTGDHVPVNIKNGPPVTIRYTRPVFWGTNTNPQFREATTAITDRMCIIKCTRSFRRPTGAMAEAVRRGYSSPAELVLADELPGLLNWALEGMRRALKQGYIHETEEMRGTTHEVDLDSNIAAGFIEECCEVAPDVAVTRPDAYAAFTIWWRENRGDAGRIPGSDSFGRAVSSLGDPRVITGKHLRFNNVRYYVGMKLNSTGMSMWEAFAAWAGSTGDASRISGSADQVNQAIPSTWSEVGQIQEDLERMREAHRRLAPSE